jgi:hypothetical protein
MSYYATQVRLYTPCFSCAEPNAQIIIDIIISLSYINIANLPQNATRVMSKYGGIHGEIESKRSNNEYESMFSLFSRYEVCLYIVLPAYLQLLFNCRKGRKYAWLERR